MGATNVKRAFAAWAGKVPPNALVCLLYMALVSKDSDPCPWFGQGHEALARHALGREAPQSDNEARADVRAVERAVGPLLTAGAIVADRRPAPRGTGPRTVRYRLMLPAIVEDDPRNTSDDRPTEYVTDDPRFPASRPTESVQTPHENRGTEEEEEPGGEKGGINQSAWAHDNEARQPAETDGLTDEPSPSAEQAHRAADDAAGRRWLAETLLLADEPSGVVIATVRRRNPQVKSLIPYLKSMHCDKNGNVKPDLLDIVEAVMGQAQRAEAEQQPKFAQADKAPASGKLPQVAEPERPSLVAVPPGTTTGPGKAAMAALDATHAQICITAGCERCARVRAEQELASA